MLNVDEKLTSKESLFQPLYRVLLTLKLMIFFSIFDSLEKMIFKRKGKGGGREK